MKKKLMCPNGCSPTTFKIIAKRMFPQLEDTPMVNEEGEIVNPPVGKITYQCMMCGIRFDSDFIPKRLLLD